METLGKKVNKKLRIKNLNQCSYNMKLTNHNYDFSTFKLRTIKVKYLPPTNFKGSRVKLNDTRHLESVTISYRYEERGTLDIAMRYLIEKGFKNDLQHDEI